MGYCAEPASVKYMHYILCTILYALYYMHYIICTILYALPKLGIYDQLIVLTARFFFFSFQKHSVTQCDTVLYSVTQCYPTRTRTLPNYPLADNFLPAT